MDLGFREKGVLEVPEGYMRGYEDFLDALKPYSTNHNHSSGICQLPVNLQIVFSMKPGRKIRAFCLYTSRFERIILEQGPRRSCLYETKVCGLGFVSKTLGTLSWYEDSWEHGLHLLS